MATISGNVCNTYVHIDLILTETGTNVDKNTSTVSWKLVGYLGSGATSSHWYSNSYHSINVKVNGSTVYDLPSTTQKSISIGTNTSASSPVTIASGTTTVPHNADGTKTCSASFSMVYRYSSSFSWNGSGSFSLKTIPRATTPTVSSSGVAMGTAVIIRTPRASSSYTHTLTYKFGNATGTIGAAKKVTTSQSWTPPLTLANQIPNSTGGTCVITCTTYNSSGTAIGSKTVSLALTVPASVVPKINSWTATDPNGYKDKYGEFIAGYSKALITVKASGIYGSSITRYAMFGYGGKSNTYTITELTASEFITNIQVTDSRGRMAELIDNVYIDILAYNQPSISKLSAVRCNSDGTANAEGNHIKITIKASITALNNKNSKSFKLEYKASDATSWTTAATYTAAYSIDTSKVIAASIDKSYRVRLTAKDDFKTIVKEVTAGTAFTLLDFYSSGKGVAVGKVAEIDELLDINLRTRHRVDEDFMIGAAIYGMDADGNPYEALYPRNSNGNTVIGYGNYAAKSGDTNIYGKGVNISISETPNPASFKPYVCKGDTLTYENIASAGYVTGGSTNICFYVPCSRYILGNPTPSAVSINGLTIRQGGKYTHGSSASAYVKPSSYSVSIAPDGGFYVNAVINTTTNAVNNDACGVRWSGKIVLS